MKDVLKFSLYRKDYAKDYTRGLMYLNDPTTLFCSSLESKGLKHVDRT
ncbi:hypothetical protein AGMMS49990_05530 [Endomicrobiia bacterium]|nr:hypothetical protein AGMMS49990_05530 [Endomicrobiia bacterium]